MIQETYCSFEQAKALKELGFPQYYKNARCIVTSQMLSYLENPYDIDSIVILNKGDEFNYTYVSHISGEYINTPTLSLVQKWLRKEKNISLEMTMFRKELAGCNLFIIDDEGIKWIKDAGTYEGEDAYEQSLSAGIDKSIELLKNMNNV